MNEKDRQAIIKLVGRLEFELRGELIRLDRRIKKIEDKLKEVKK